MKNVTSMNKFEKNITEMGFLGTLVSVIKFSINTMKYHSVIVNTFVGVNPGRALKKCVSQN